LSKTWESWLAIWQGILFQTFHLSNYRDEYSWCQAAKNTLCCCDIRRKRALAELTISNWVDFPSTLLS
jgi:hypothetical protein